MFILNPYKLSLLNIGLLALFLFWFLKFRPKFGKAILVLACLPIISFFRHTDFNGGMVQNAALSAAFFESLSEGNLIPRWAERLDTHFGYPAFLFLYPLPFYLSALFHLLGFSFVNSTKLVFVSSYLISGWWMWNWAKLKFSHWPALAATIGFLFAPYRFINMHFRLDIGESVAVALLPLLYLCVEKMNYLGLSLASFFIILAHPAISITGLGLMSVYLTLRKKWKDISFMCIGILMATYYWLPILLESKFTHMSHFTHYIEFFSWQNYLFSPFKWGLLFQGGEGKMVFPIGYTLFLISFLSFLKLRNFNYKIKFWLAAFLFICFLLLPQSSWLWNNLPFFNKFQFSYRVLGVMTIVTAMISGYFFQSVHKNKKTWIIIFILLTTGTTVLNWGNRESRPYSMPDKALLELLPIQSRMWGTGFPQALPIWTDLNLLWGPEKIDGPIEIISGTGTMTPIFRNSTRHEYKVVAETDLLVKENTFYYPGWEVYVDNKKLVLNEKYINKLGVIEIEIFKNAHFVNLKYSETPIRLISLILSTFTALLLFSFMSKNNYIIGFEFIGKYFSNHFLNIIKFFKRI